MSDKIGFIGLGTMGEPMARNLAKSGRALIVWNRNPIKCVPLADEGAILAQSPTDVFKQARIVFLMLADSDATDTVLQRNDPKFQVLVRDHIIVNTATLSPDYSQILAADIQRAGGAYVEAPVSGSRTPAEAGQLIAMVAGDGAAIREVLPLLGPICRTTIECGPPPRALHMKLATNTFLIATITGLVEAAHFAKSLGLDMEAWAKVMNASQMASDISRVKVEKLLSGNFVPQAAIINVHETNRLVCKIAQSVGIAAPLMETSLALYQESLGLGHGEADMVAVIHALQAKVKAAQEPQ